MILDCKITVNVEINRAQFHNKTSEPLNADHDEISMAEFMINESNLGCLEDLKSDSVQPSAYTDNFSPPAPISTSLFDYQENQGSRGTKSKRVQYDDIVSYIGTKTPIRRSETIEMTNIPKVFEGLSE